MDGHPPLWRVTATDPLTKIAADRLQASFTKQEALTGGAC